MHHNPAKNVLWVSMLADEIAGKMGRDITDVLDLLAIARAKLNAERLKRPTPFIDKTIYTNWNALCISAYLHYARVTRRPDARHFALRSLDRILAEAWVADRGLSHVIAYSDPTAEKRFISGLLDDYAYTAIACLDAYEISGDFSYFRFAQQIADEMIRRFADPTSGGFFDTEGSLDDTVEARRAFRSPQAVPGRAHSRWESLCGHRAAAVARLHKRRKVSRQGGGHG